MCHVVSYLTQFPIQRNVLCCFIFDPVPNLSCCCSKLLPVLCFTVLFFSWICPAIYFFSILFSPPPHPEIPTLHLILLSNPYLRKPSPHGPLLAGGLRTEKTGPRGGVRTGLNPQADFNLPLEGRHTASYSHIVPVVSVVNVCVCFLLHFPSRCIIAIPQSTPSPHG